MLWVRVSEWGKMRMVKYLYVFKNFSKIFRKYCLSFFYKILSDFFVIMKKVISRERAVVGWRIRRNFANTSWSSFADWEKSEIFP